LNCHRSNYVIWARRIINLNGQLTDVRRKLTKHEKIGAAENSSVGFLAVDLVPNVFAENAMTVRTFPRNKAAKYRTLARATGDDETANRIFTLAAGLAQQARDGTPDDE
jgi:hypothetical protein